MRRIRFSSGLIFAGMLLVGPPASAKVIFTGYADIRVAPQTTARVSGTDSLLASLGVVNRRSESRAFTMDSMGIFAAAPVSDNVDFLVDFTYKKVGAKVEETRIQYAYLDYHPELLQFKAGRITLPIGLYNEHYFYPFQRYAATPPIFQSAIIGLPIADHGAMVTKTLDVGLVDLYGAAFVVNGYGPSKSSTDTFRAGLGATDALLIANNLSHTNVNRNFAYGGNVGLSFFEGKNVKVGVSSYDGKWNASNDDNFLMRNAYVSAEVGPVKLLGEILHTETDNDKGVTGFFGARDWKSSGGFVEGVYRVLKTEWNEVALFAGTERTTAHAMGSGANGEERLLDHKGGVFWRLNTNVALKSEFNYLDYTLPIQSGGSAQDIRILQRQVLFSLCLTY